MKIEKLDNDKIRIILNIEDLKNNNIDFHSFMSNSKESQNLFLYMLDIAEEQLGFITDNYKVSIETMYLNNGSFVLNITRFKTDSFLKTPRVTTKRKDFSSDPNSSIYVFSSIDDFLDFYSKFTSCINLDIFKDCKYSLYYFESKYYMIINSDCLNTKYRNLFLYILSEFSNLITNSQSIITNLQEHGKCLCKNKKFMSTATL